MRMTTADAQPAADYYEVHSVRGKGKNVHRTLLCVAHARDRKHAIRIAHNNGLPVTQTTDAVRVGVEGYVAGFSRSAPTITRAENAHTT